MLRVSPFVTTLKIKSDQVTEWPSDRVTEWLSDRVTKCPSDQVTDWVNNWVIGWLEASQTIDRMVYLFIFSVSYCRIAAPCAICLRWTQRHGDTLVSCHPCQPPRRPSVMQHTAHIRKTTKSMYYLVHGKWVANTQVWAHCQCPEFSIISIRASFRDHSVRTFSVRGL